jgi:hypothetical protein
MSRLLIIYSLPLKIFLEGGGFGPSINDDIFGTQIVDTLKFHLWECKINKKIPDFNAIKNEVTSTLGLYIKVNRTFENNFYNSSILRR